ncbi:MAG: UDP-N-acetylmuramate dehydrogenase [Candidatus Fonsibacter sp.]|jgi:UDP-N-acetylmuramate dehydrogenase|uniref:UDP-N-acetylmuramate dehydrogenase n=1 Tax=Candidatus Fonsibacter ubiquis TaxID=1925548 RepID=UPI00013E78CB|nr:UDP-N-acetylmuramate dehydrogenase [Candidatus Fonsibacter ubiquis]MBU6305994.1 UDP-N-acetylmuramate dehydrogenase [Pseudomonadota bacterium]GBL34273.1 UDP-N-acetylenolpyruvoylglucosamine reductase [Pelagibacterales bacterium]NCU45078.1 UDP-N-acetylmuramate dehydrogenase [Candidatus Fonsibacter ubiquis]NCU51174.1 UDP-N-acetylmuramate dehydrogenase [Candidatus Fonsibacter ubiquis]NCU52063.1 UDP-N-acetylmuramate dehydrogenase [Candidatus Fonsibacter ubiquis]
MSINFYSQLKKNLQGELRENFDLSKSNWLGIGGKANFFFKPKDLNDLQIFLRNNNQHFPIIVIGSGSNLLIRDKGFEGVVIKFGKNFDYIKINNEIINCGPATQKTLLAETAANNNLTGFEFLYCIPGTIAGGIVMNSGCYGSDISKIVLSISVIDMNGEIKIINNKDINFSYRKSSLTKNQIITNIEMKGSFLKKEKVIEIMRNLKNKKDFEQPQKIKTGGSTFKNPRDSDKKAWELIKESGCADLRVGGIKLSKLHCNFLENLDGATSEDAENLIENIKQQVFKKTNINLELELEVVGKK